MSVTAENDPSVSWITIPVTDGADSGHSPGAFSLDAILGLESLWTPGIVWATIAIGVAGGVVNLALRGSAPQSATA